MSYNILTTEDKLNMLIKHKGHCSLSTIRCVICPVITLCNACTGPVTSHKILVWSLMLLSNKYTMDDILFEELL